MALPKLHVEKEWLKDPTGRVTILRGVNLGGDSKVPYPNGSTHIPTDFSDHRDVSFIGRPFPLADADEHFSRLRAWGFNVLRLLTTWEAVEHKGPNEYDTQYIDYYAELCKMANDYGMYVFVDFHQDVWSRMTGGDGAPCWLFEKVGIDYTKLSAADAAIVMQHKFNFSDPRDFQPENYAMMSWGQNYKYAGNAIMWTLFFGGRDFASNFQIDGKNAQDYMQEHYINCLLEIGKKIKHLPNILGFDSLNEPHRGWIQRTMDDRHTLSRKNEPALPGIAWSPIDALYASHGFALDMPFNELSILRGGFVPKRTVTVNPNKVSLWLDDRQDPFQIAGAWELTADNMPKIARNDHFQRVGGREINFTKDYMFPFINKVADAIRTINPDWIIFAEKDAVESAFVPDFPANTPKNMVNATHWYDNAINGTKHVNYPITLDILTKRPVFGKKGIQKMYIRQLGMIKDVSLKANGGSPTLIGEFGITMDLDHGKAYKAWQNGDHSTKPWNSHIMTFDLMYNALDALMINSTHWNYTAPNQNNLRVGDCWNQEDLSIYSIDQRSDPADLNSGGRALEGCVRPFPHFIQGTPIEMKFNRKSGLYILRFQPNLTIDSPTELFIPKLQYITGYNIDAPGCAITEKINEQLIFFHAKTENDICITISRN
jgi:hypothetical protein